MNYEFLRNYLKKHKITREQFAKDMQMPIGTVNTMFQRKSSKVSYELVRKIVNAYDISYEDLFGDYSDEYITVNYEKLDEIINDRGISRAKVAQRIDIYPGTLGNAFIRKSKMRKIYVQRIATLLHVSTSDFSELHDFKQQKKEDTTTRSEADPYDLIAEKLLEIVEILRKMKGQ